MEILTVKDIKNILNIGLNQAYDIIKMPGFPCVKIGRCYRIDKEQFEKWYHNHERI